MRPFKTRFRCAYTYRLKLAGQTKSLTHYTKGTPSGHPWNRSAISKALRFQNRQSDCKGVPPTACRRPVSGTVSLPSSGCFSPFPHGTGSLSVSKEYLAFGGGPPIFRQDFTCPALLDMSHRSFLYGAVTLCCRPFQTIPVTSARSAGPRSLATTSGVSLDFLSSGYLDVSVPRVCS